MSPMSGSPAVLIVSFNTCKKTRYCVESLLRSSPSDMSLFIVDNGSADGSAAMLETVAQAMPDRVTLKLLTTNIGYAPAVNLLYPLVPLDRDLCYVNSDVYVGAGWCEGLQRHLARDDRIAVVAPMGFGIGGWQDAAIHGVYERPAAVVERSHVVNSGTSFNGDEAAPDLADATAFTVKSFVGAIWMVRSAAHRDVGGLDSACACGGDDADWSLHARERGWKLVVARDVVVRHDGHSSFRQLGDEAAPWITQSWDAFNRKWSGRFGSQSWQSLMTDRVSSLCPPYTPEAWRD